MRTYCAYPSLRTLGDVADCPKPQGNLPMASGNARGVDRRCLAEVPNWHAHGCVRSSVLPVVARTSTRNLHEKVEYAVVRTVVAHSSTLITLAFLSQW